MCLRNCTDVQRDWTYCHRSGQHVIVCMIWAMRIYLPRSLRNETCGKRYACFAQQLQYNFADSRIRYKDVKAVPALVICVKESENRILCSQPFLPFQARFLSSREHIADLSAAANNMCDLSVWMSASAHSSYSAVNGHSICSRLTGPVGDAMRAQTRARRACLENLSQTAEVATVCLSTLCWRRRRAHHYAASAVALAQLCNPRSFSLHGCEANNRPAISGRS